MYVESIELKNYRNYDEILLELNDGLIFSRSQYFFWG